MSKSKPSEESDLLQLWINVTNDRIKSFVNDIVERLKDAITSVVAEQMASLRDLQPSQPCVAEEGWLGEG